MGDLLGKLLYNGKVSDWLAGERASMQTNRQSDVWERDPPYLHYPIPYSPESPFVPQREGSRKARRRILNKGFYLMGKGYYKPFQAAQQLRR